MSLETKELHSTLAQERRAEEKENDDPSEQRTTHGPCHIKLPVSPIRFSLGSIPDDDEVMEASISVSACSGPPKKASLHVRKFFYPRFKRRACGIYTSGSVQCLVKEKEKKENCLQIACISETLSNVDPTKELLQQADSRNKSHGLPYEVSLKDIANCDSPAKFLRQGDEKGFFPRSCNATPCPSNRNSAFRCMESPGSEKIPVLSFTSPEEQQHKIPTHLLPSPFSGRGENVSQSIKSKAVLCNNNVLMNASNLTEAQNLDSGACKAEHQEKDKSRRGDWVDEHDKENNPPALKSIRKAVIVYRSLQKTKKRGKMRLEEILSPRQARDGGTGILRTRSRARLDMAVYSRQIRSGPVLRSSQILQLHPGKMIKERSLSAYGLKKSLVKALLEKYLWSWRLKCGTPSRRDICLPFLNGEAGRRVECFYCKAFVAPHDLTSCSHKDCSRIYHLTCGQRLEDFYFRKNGDAVCPQHVCMVCKAHNKSKVFRCERCTVAAHKKCFAFPENAIFLDSKPDCFICWRHPQDWRLESEYKVSTTDTKEAFKRLPLPYGQVEFSIGTDLPDEVSGNGLEPTPFVHIRRNVFLVKKKRDDFDDGVGCTCKGSCRDNCVCRAQSMSCSKSCTCDEKCGNKPFRRERRIKLVKTMGCGWGVQSTESIVKGEFIIEYVGEVINEAMCEERLWTLKERGDHNFYMCEIGKNFIIDATFKGNASRFVNHSCDPNCNLEKWRVDGEIRVGIFAKRDIEDGEALTYDYRFVQFGPNVKCRCGSLNCRGDLGESYQLKRTKQQTSSTLEIPAWGEKHRRSQKHLDSTSIETA